eukprot:jgi/Galph1/1240/GphlegSOOS_G5942.1
MSDSAKTASLCSNLALSPQVTEGCILVCPMVSIGNVPQLAVDLLLENLPFRYAGIVDSSALIPFYGHGALNDASEITTAMQAYVLERTSTKPNIVCLQVRTPPAKSQNESFVSEIESLAKYYKCLYVVFLTSFSALSIIPGGALEPGQRRLIRTELSENCSQLETTAFDYVGVEYFEQDKSSLFFKFWERFHTSRQDCVALGLHVYEGDNIDDAAEFFRGIIKFLQVRELFGDQQVKFPRSWGTLL